MQNLDEVHIKLPSDTWRIIYVSLQNTVLECKHVIEKSYGVPYEVQRLFYDNVILPDSKILCNCGIQPGDKKMKNLGASGNIIQGYCTTVVFHGEPGSNHPLP